MRVKTAIMATLLMLGFGVRGTAQELGFNLIVVGDPQPQTEEQIARLEGEIVPKIGDIVEEYRATSDLPIAILLTGDVVWDTMEFLPRVKAMFESLGVPVYAVIGNHDHDRGVDGDEPLAQSHYEATFGERYYTFDLGSTRFVALDNISYNNYYDYSLDVDKEQLKWLRKLMRKREKHLPHDTLVFNISHNARYAAFHVPPALLIVCKSPFKHLKKLNLLRQAEPRAGYLLKRSCIHEKSIHQRKVLTFRNQSSIYGRHGQLAHLLGDLVHKRIHRVHRVPQSELTLVEVVYRAGHLYAVPLHNHQCGGDTRPDIKANTLLDNLGDIAGKPPVLVGRGLRGKPLRREQSLKGCLEHIVPHHKRRAYHA